MTLTISILNWNGKSYLEECLESIPRHIEADRLLIDNASTDESWKIAEKYGFRVFHATNEHKFITGLNSAIREAYGTHILFSQADVIFQKGCIERLIYHSTHDEPSIIQPVFHDWNGKVDNAGMNYVWPSYGIGIRKPISIKYDVDIATSITFIAPRLIFKDVGLFDENFSPGYYEDVDMALRCRYAGYANKVAADCYVRHRHNESFSTAYSKLGISDICRKNRKYLINKHYAGFDRASRLAVTTCLDIMKKPIDVIAQWGIAANNRK